MKNMLAFLAAMTVFCAQAVADNFNPKFGKVSQEEVAMTSYPEDPEAQALFIFDKESVTYSKGFNVVHDVYFRIKIFKKEAEGMANVQIPVHGGTDVELSGLAANTYNLVSGKVVKTELPKKNIFREKVTDKLTMVKFSLPEVREGSVIEYKYTLSTPYLGNVPDLDIQRDQPVLHSRMEICLPEFIGYSVTTRGRFKVNVEQGQGPDNFMVGSNNYNTKLVTAVNDNVPALKGEPMVWCLEDYRAGLDVEVSGIELHVGNIHLSERFSNTWDNVNETLIKSRLGDNQKAKNPFKDEVREITAATLSDAEKIRQILKLVSGRVKSNGGLSLYPDSPSGVLKKGTGNVADINNLLSVALHDAGFETDLILLNPRGLGRLPYFPTIQKVSTFIVRTKDSEGNYYFLDASDPESDLNVLSSRFLVDRGRIFGVGSDKAWVNLSSPARNSTSMMVLASLNEGGELKGNYTRMMTNQDAYSFNSSYHKAESEDKFIEEEIEKENGISVESATFEGVGTMAVSESVTFTKTPDKTGEYIYLNPTILPFMSGNPFDQQQRLLPVEFPVTENNSLQITLMAPEGYTIEEAPQSISASACGGDVVFRYLTQTTGNSISARLTLTVGRVLFSTEEYEDLRQLFGKVAEVCNSRIVIKKN